ncbi:hypothetical protein [Ornithinimicrobium cavernae]|uniref:hypothetical protein n=1 Tax=Ornithinimicrobium cavernae TaxID=2666047 RepID=UPI000D68F1E5|nr:hypothetical protein [Ornithinimicrobium cavernae]
MDHEPARGVDLYGGLRPASTLKEILFFLEHDKDVEASAEIATPAGRRAAKDIREGSSHRVRLVHYNEGTDDAGPWRFLALAVHYDRPECPEDGPGVVTVIQTVETTYEGPEAITRYVYECELSGEDLRAALHLVLAGIQPHRLAEYVF